ncbi:MAG: hypothetical protein GC159_15905 [Phycisphaera sp.]|nr:hypothetical protein [Phycisphaera sp.]
MSDKIKSTGSSISSKYTPVCLGTLPSFGFGDRIGLATPGHAEAMHRAGEGIYPIFAQQSVREMKRTNRSPRQVMMDAQHGMKVAKWRGRSGADADHLKSRGDVDAMIKAGFTFFTIDPSDYVDTKADDYDEDTLTKKFEAIRGEIDWFNDYDNKMITLPTDTVIDIDHDACMRCAVKYGRAIKRATQIGEYIHKACQIAEHEYEIELSVDETPQPTTLAEHYIFAREFLKTGVKLVSLAPRFIGDFEKGVDYKGDVHELEKSIRNHNGIAQLLGPYKLSLHSGSDKISMYPAFARATKGRFHVKTAGTSYLEALRVVCKYNEDLFRRVVDFSRARYDIDKATYHVSATLDDAPPPDDVPDNHGLEYFYLESWVDVPEGKGFTNLGRQILHCTFGSVLTDPELGPAIIDCLKNNFNAYTECLASHFAHHLDALKSGM